MRMTIALLALVVAGCTGESGPKFDAEPFIAEVSTWEAVKDVAVPEDASAAWVGVLDNGQDRSGYARAVCEVVREHALRPGSAVYVKVLDVAKAAQQNKTVVLGEYRCEL